MKSYESGISGSCMVQILEAELHCITHGSNEIANFDVFLYTFITNYDSLLEYTHLICKAKPTWCPFAGNHLLCLAPETMPWWCQMVSSAYPFEIHATIYPLVI